MKYDAYCMDIVLCRKRNSKETYTRLITHLHEVASFVTAGPVM